MLRFIDALSVNVQDRSASNSVSRGDTISILAFEVANTIVKGSNLLQSLSKESIQIFKKEILYSEGVQLLVSTNIKELLSIAAADKSEEFEVLLREVVRFGNRCKDPQWHDLDHYFSRLRLGIAIIKKHHRKEVEITMQELANLAQSTYELFHELHALEKFEQLYRCKIEEVESQNLPRKGKSLLILQSELKHQRQLVRNLRKKSLWSKNLSKVMEKLVDVVTFIHQAFVESFEKNVKNSRKKANKKTERLGVSGLALHYANLITQMDIIASHSICVLPNMRDKLYNGLPANVKAGLRYRLRALYSKEVMTVPQIKEEMEKVLHWLVPIATDTIKYDFQYSPLSQDKIKHDSLGLGLGLVVLVLVTGTGTDKKKLQFFVSYPKRWDRDSLSISILFKRREYPLHPHNQKGNLHTIATYFAVATNMHNVLTFIYR